MSDAGRRTAIVTGGAGGIGRVLCARLTADGWRAVAVDRDGEALAALPEGIERQEVDVGDEAAVAACFDELALDRLDLLVNNAGIAHPDVGLLDEQSLDTFRAYIDSHLTGAFLMTRAALPALRAAKGTVVNISSTRALMSEPNSEPYAAAKGGLVALTHALAVSHGPEVRANAILPGWIVTEKHGKLTEEDHAQHPAGRAGTPDDIADAVLYLADAGFVTGQTLVVDGGMTKKMIYAE
jgi:NAD(P)-dependent dehydrogenase (short-subunit alcohol dehydrogenase family)